jgi:hypothetical protein
MTAKETLTRGELEELVQQLPLSHKLAFVLEHLWSHSYGIEGVDGPSGHDLNKATSIVRTILEQLGPEVIPRDHVAPIDRDALGKLVWSSAGQWRYSEFVK